MGNSTQYSLPPVSLVSPADIKISVVQALVAGTEYTLALTSGVKQLEIQPRTGCILSFRFQNSGEYKTIPKGNMYNVTGINFVGKTLYIKSNTTVDVEVTEYY